MRKTLFLLLSCLLVPNALSQTEEQQRRAVQRARAERLWTIEKRIAATRPQRRDSPLRYENIRDNEISEIQRAAAKAYPEALFNISGVVTGCPCEEGPACSDQVWILASRYGKTMGLLLSKIKGRWEIGPIQQWWLEYEQLGKRRDDRVSRSSFFTLGDEHTEKFPLCAAQPDTKKVAGLN